MSGVQIRESAKKNSPPQSAKVLMDGIVTTEQCVPVTVVVMLEK
jgi:hypothetical protein